MPKITIREKDLTTAGNISVTTNAVYIPGYANVGPINTPTLCETLSDFTDLFGNEPYKFRSEQPWPVYSSTTTPKTAGFSGQDIVTTSRFYSAGEYEKSYVMAKQLLKLGLPVVYERVFNVGTDNPNNKDSWTASCTVDSNDDEIGYKIKSVSPGLVGTKIKFTMESENVTIGSEKLKRYKLTVWREEDEKLGTSDVPSQITYLTTTSKISKQYSDTKLLLSGVEMIDNTGLVSIKVTFSTVNAELVCPVVDDKAEEKQLTINSAYDTLTTDEFLVTDMYNYLSSSDNSFDILKDKGEFVIKFITSGAYPTFNYTTTTGVKLHTKLMEIAADRGDCTALIDHTPNNKRSLSGTTSVFAAAKSDFSTKRVTTLGSEDYNIYSAMFTPYGIYETTMGDMILPASFGYLSALAVQVQTANNWLSTAGVNRGYVPGLKSLCQNVTNAIADSYQPRDSIAINPITNIKPYGLVIWGARTLKDNKLAGDLTATSFLNVRQISNDTKRQVFVAAKSLTFEQNNEISWIRFKNKLTPLLDLMVNGNAISAYELKRQKTDKKATIKAVIRLYAIEPIEDWDITVELADSSTEVMG